MRALLIAVSVCILASCGSKNEARAAHDEEVAYVHCLSKDWYPGVTDPKAPRVQLVIQYVDKTTNYRPKDMCMTIDGRPLLSTLDRAAVIPRLEKREGMTGRGTVSPGKHDLGVHVRSSTEGSGGARDEMAHDAHSFEASDGTTVEITATSPEGKLTLQTK